MKRVNEAYRAKIRALNSSPRILGYLFGIVGEISDDHYLSAHGHWPPFSKVDQTPDDGSRPLWDANR